MREMKDSGIEWMGKIPSSWDTMRVKHAFKRIKEEAHQKEPIVLALSRSGVKKRDISNNEGQIAESYYNYNKVKSGDLLINPMDLYSGANCSVSNIEGVISPAYVNLRSFKGFSSRYYDYYFKVQYWTMAFFAHGRGVSYENRWTLNSETLMNYPIIVPPLKTQKQIADYLDNKCSKIATIIDGQEKIIEKLRECKESIITETISTGLNPLAKKKNSGLEWIKRIPSSWEITKLSRCLITNKGFAFKSNVFKGEGVPVIRVSEIKSGTVVEPNVFVEKVEPEYEKVKLFKGDIVMTTVGSNPKMVNSAVGQLARIPSGLDGSLLNQNAVCLRANSLINKDYLFYFLSIKSFREHLNLIAHGTANQYSISLKEILEFDVLIPSLNEQALIAEKLNGISQNIDEIIQERKKIIEKLKEYEKSLIYEVITGKVDVE